MLKTADIRSDTDLAAAQLPCNMRHGRQLSARMHTTRIKQRWVWHQQIPGAALRSRDGSRQVGMNSFAIDCKLGQFFLHGRLLVESRLAHIEQRCPDH